MKLYTINLAHRTDRWARCEEIARKHGFELERVPAIETKGRGWIGCALSHQLAVFEARVRNDPYVVVAEDDFEATPLFHELRYVIEAGDHLGLDAIYGGTVSFPDGVVAIHPGINRRLIETTTYLSSHLTVYFARAYEKMLSMPFGCGSDWNQNPHGGLPDHAQPLPHPPMRRGLCWPFLSIQRDDFSDNCQRDLKLANNWRMAEDSWSGARAP